MKEGKGLFLSQCEARDRRVHRDSTVFACVVATFMKQRTSSMIIDVKLYKWTLQKLLCLPEL